MSPCPFCRIVAGELPAERVHETDRALAFLDVVPRARAHVMVIPKVHAPTLVDLDGASVGELFRAVQEVMARIERSLRPIAFHVGWNHGSAAGQAVPHIHVHVLPRFARPGRGIQALGEGTQEEDLPAIAAAIRGA